MMENNISRSILPISICCVIHGFSVIRFRQKILAKMAKAYCCAVTIFGLKSWLLTSVRKLSEEKPFGFVGVLYTVMDSIRTTTLTYYRIKCIKSGNVFTDILETISHVDEFLEGAGIKVRHTRNLIFSTLYTVLTLTVNACIWYVAVFKVNLETITKTLQLSNTWYSILLKCFAFNSFILFVMHFVFVVFSLRERLELVLLAIENFSENKLRKLAWDRETGVLVLGHFRSLMFMKHNYLKQIQKLLCSMYDVFFNTNNFHKNMFNSCFLFSMLLSSITILLMVADLEVFHLFAAFNYLLQYCVIPICACVLTANEFQRIQSTAWTLYYTNNCNTFNRNVKTLYFNSFHMENQFDSGYFKIEWTLLLSMINFVPVFVFGMFSLQLTQ